MRFITFVQCIVGRLHVWVVFHVRKIEHGCIKNNFQPYKLIRDIAYPLKPWMYYPFKGGKVEANWDFIQYSTRMCVERPFANLKDRYRLIMK